MHLGKDPLAYLVGNQTRRMTHTLAFQWLISLEKPLHHAACFHQDDIVVAQVGAEQSKKKQTSLKKSALDFCDLIDD